MEASVSNVTPIIDAYLDTNIDFRKYEPELQSQIKQIANNMGYRFYSEFDSEADLVDWIDNTLVPAFENADTQKLLTELFAINTNDMAVSEYVTQINSLINKIAEAIGGDAEQIKIQLGFEFVDTHAQLLQQVKQKIEEAFGSNDPTAGSTSLLGDITKSETEKQLEQWVNSLQEEDLLLLHIM